MQKSFSKTQSRIGFLALLAMGGLLPAFIPHAYAADLPQTKLENQQTPGIQKASAGSLTNTPLQQKNNVVPPIPTTDAVATGAVFESTSRPSAVSPLDSKTATAVTNQLNPTTTNTPAKSDSTRPTTDLPAQTTNTNQAPVPQAASVDSTNPILSPNNQGKIDKDSKTDATAVNPNSTSGSQQTVVPNGAALQTQLMPLGQGESSPWSTLVAGGCLILGIAFAGVMAVRIKQGRGLIAGRSEKQLQLVTSMALSPKRQILLVKIRDKEVALASTEHGITLLTELTAPSKNNLTLLDDGGSEEPKKRKVQQRTLQEEPAKLVASAESAGEETALARSEMLMGALKNLREKNLRNKNGSNDDLADSSSKQPSPTAQTLSKEKLERELPENLAGDPTKRESTLKQTRAAFPKYLANAFEQESKRALPQSQQQNSQDDAGNVTSMIRERLKELRPLS